MSTSADPSAPAPPAETRSTCPYCGVGCGVVIERRGEQIVGVRGDPDHPANFGRLCSKGSSLHLTAAPVRMAQARAREPMLRESLDAPLRPVDWDTAQAHLVERFADCIARHGPDSVAFYLSGQLLTEDYYVFNKLAKGLIGTNNVDSNSRLCMSSAVAAYRQTLGADAPPAAYEDIDHADCIFIAGANPAFAHPVLFRRIEAAKASRPSLRIVVVDPRRTDSAEFADLHLPILPGTDVALFSAMLNHLLWEGRVDRAYIDAHTSGFEALRESIRECTPRWASAICGVDEALIVQAARWFGEAGAVLSLYCQGLNQSTSGTAKNAALIHLHLACAQIGRPGAGPFSLTGQPNAMGGREVGALANLLPAHRDLASAADRAEVAAFWSVPDVPERPGKSAVELFRALEAGEIRMVWIVCTNPAQSMPDLGQVTAALRKAELVVVQEAYRDTETTAFAHVLLPASSWGEKEGTVTNSERRISRVRAAVDAPGLARADWAIAAEFARRLRERALRTGCLRPAPRPRRIGFDYSDPESVWIEHRASTRGRDLDIGGLSYRLLETLGPQQWPRAHEDAPPAVRLYADGRFAHADGRARFVPTPYRRVAEPVDARHPLRLLTGRLRDQWHGMSRTGTTGQAFGHAPEAVIELSAADLDARRLAPGQLVRIESRRGAIVLPVAQSPTLRSGSTFIAMHWGGEFLNGAGVNTLTLGSIDPVSKQPELKHCAIRVEPAALPHELLLMAWLPGQRAIELRRALLGEARDFEYASAVLFGRDEEGVRLRLASAAPIAAARLTALERRLDAFGGPVLRYEDRHQRRLVAVADGRLRAFLLAGDLRSAGWLSDWLVSNDSVEGLGARLLMASSTPPAARPAGGRLVCACFGVSEQRIRACASQHGDASPQARLEHVQRELHCGTQCGSCKPELRRLVSPETCDA